MEANLTGLIFFILASLCTSIYLIFLTNFGLFFKIMSGIGEIALLSMLSSSLVTSYSQYYFYKVSMNLYPPDEKLALKIDEAKTLIKELNKLVGENSKDSEDKSYEETKEKNTTEFIPDENYVNLTKTEEVK